MTDHIPGVGKMVTGSTIRKAVVWLALAAAVVQAACHTVSPPEPIVRTVTVAVPVATSCVPPNLPELPTEHATPEALRAADDGQAVLLITADLVALRDWASVAAPVIASCRAAGGVQ